MHAPPDPSSLSNPHEVQVKHVSLALQVDFDKSILKGTAELDAFVVKDHATRLVLDTSDLVIGSIKIGGKQVKWLQHPSHPIFGSALEISLPQKTRRGDNYKVVIAYSTSPRGSALQWLPAEQTAGKERPYFFTQCQAIHARSLLPCQDAPAVKVTYTATISCPPWATCLMSALCEPAASADVAEADAPGVFRYRQPVPLPSYLIAMAVGLLESREISGRCRVWSEPSVVDLAASDFSQTEEFLQAAESLTCEYQWGRYDVLCLPPSFPYGGMENPCLTFVTPTLLSGDKALACVVAHEIAHSWSGNLVTNATWSHFWLNEGLTRWLEARIVAKVTKDPTYVGFDARLGWDTLKEDVADYEAAGKKGLTALVPNLDGVDPDDNVSAVPYEKGMALLNELERRMGVREFGGFVRAYVQHFKFKTVTSAQFKQYFSEYFHAKHSLFMDFDWDTWLYVPGMPPTTPVFDESLFEESWALADAWAACTAESPSPADPKAAAFATWPWKRRVVVLERVMAQTKETGSPLPLAVLEAMDAAYGLSKSRNSELSFRWQLLCLRAGHWAIVPDVVAFLTRQGRMKFTRPLYRELLKYPETKDVAVSTFLDQAYFYHPICRGMVAKDLGVEALPRSAPAPAPVLAASAPGEGDAAGAVVASEGSGQPGASGLGDDARKDGGGGGWVVLSVGVVAAAFVAGALMARRLKLVR